MPMITLFTGLHSFRLRMVDVEIGDFKPVQQAVGGSFLGSAGLLFRGTSRKQGHGGRGFPVTLVFPDKGAPMEKVTWESYDASRSSVGIPPWTKR